MKEDRQDGYFVKRNTIHNNFDGEVFSEGGGYTDEYTEWLEDCIISSADSMIYNIDHIEGRLYHYSELLKDEDLSDDKKEEVFGKYRNLNSRVIGMKTFGLRTLDKLIKNE